MKTQLTKLPDSKYLQNAGTSQTHDLEKRHESITQFFSLQQISAITEVGKVVVACDRKGKRVLIRVKKKSKIEDLSEYRETLEKLKNLDLTPNVVKIQRIFEDSSFFHTVTDFHVDTDNVLNFLKYETRVTQTKCIKLLRGIVSGIASFHRNGFILRNVNPENMIFVNGDVVISNFSEASPCESRFDRLVGDVNYLAPECFLLQYSEASDLYSLGVIMYILVTSRFPRDLKYIDNYFELSRIPAELLEDPTYENPNWFCFKHLKRLCKSLLKFEFRDRPSSEEVLRDPFFSIMS